jgi:hypothetical protein
MSRIAVAIALVSACACGKSSSSSSSHPEDAKIRAGMREMAGQPAEDRQAFAGAVLAEIAGAKLGAVGGAFGELESVPPEMRRLVLAKALSDPAVAAAWMKICPAGLQAFAAMAQLPLGEHGKHLWQTCPLSGHGVIDEAQAARTDGGALAVGLIAASQLSGKLERDVISFFLAASPAPP